MSLEDRFRHALGAALADASTRLESEFEATLTDVRAEAERERAAALTAAGAATATAVAEAREAVQRELLGAFESDKASLVATHQSLLTQAVDAARLEVTRITEVYSADNERARAEADDAHSRMRAEAESTVEAIRAELREAQTAAVRQRDDYEQAASRAHAEGEAEVTRLGEALALASGERDQLREVLTRLQEEHATAAAAASAHAETTVSTLRAEAQAAHAILRNEAEATSAALAQAVEIQQAAGARLLESVRALDGAASLPEVLDALAHGTGKEAGRAAVLVVKGDRLIGWRSTGFGAVDEDPRSIESSTSDVGALAAAVNTGRPAIVGNGSVLAAPAFGLMDVSSVGLAVPLLVAGKPVAVVYADPGSASPMSGWTSPVELLVRHAGRCIEALAVQRPAHARSGVRVGAPA